MTTVWTRGRGGVVSVGAFVLLPEVVLLAEVVGLVPRAPLWWVVAAGLGVGSAAGVIESVCAG